MCTVCLGKRKHDTPSAAPLSDPHTSQNKENFTHSSGITPLMLMQESVLADLAGLFFANFNLIALLNHLTKLSVGQSTNAG
jgi:hypothetical protein